MSILNDYLKIFKIVVFFNEILNLFKFKSNYMKLLL